MNLKKKFIEPLICFQSFFHGIAEFRLLIVLTFLYYKEILNYQHNFFPGYRTIRLSVSPWLSFDVCVSARSVEEAKEKAIGIDEIWDGIKNGVDVINAEEC